MLLKPENKAMLVKVLTYHVVPGKLDARALGKKIKEGNGSATLTTASGGTLTATMQGEQIVIKDAKSDVAIITIEDVYQSNGVIQVIDTVLLPS